MVLAFYLILFLLGAVFGSFGGVIIERGREGFARADWKRVFGGRSYCPSCHTTLTRRQLIPIFGWLIQWGKCIRCKLPIPSRYVREELLMGSVFSLVGRWVIGGDLTLLVDPTMSAQLLFRLFFARWSVLLVLADLFRYELNLYVRILMLISVIIAQVTGVVGSPLTMLIWAGVLTAIFRLIYLAARRRQTKQLGVASEWFGLGDVWMAALVGAMAGVVFGWPISRVSRIQITFAYLTVSSALGIIFRLVRNLLTGEKNHSLPFLPAMIATFRLFAIFHGSIIHFFDF